MPFYATYAATKAGIAHFGEALRRELYGEGVHVLTVYPGATSTPMMESSKAGAAEGFEYEPPSRSPTPPSKPSWTAASPSCGAASNAAT